MIIKIIPTDTQIEIIDRAERILNSSYMKYAEINIDDLFDIIDELSAEVDRLEEEVEEK
jgi:hypothetical protein